MILLEKHQIEQKIERLAIEILEHNYEEPAMVLIGINERGKILAERLQRSIQKYSVKPIHISMQYLTIDVAAPTLHPITLHGDKTALENTVVILVDDVANSGRTLYYALKPLLDIASKKVELAVLIDRRHKKFPIRPNYVGFSLATTIEEHIEVSFQKEREQAILL